jgi:hypothetical protein
MSEARLNLAPWEENAHARVGKAVRQNARDKQERRTASPLCEGQSAEAVQMA